MSTESRRELHNYGQCDVGDWTDIVAIAAGYRHTVGLRSDGTVLSTSGFTDRRGKESVISQWSDVVAIASGFKHTVCIKADGSVLTTPYSGDDDYYCGECNTDGWKLFDDIDTLREERESFRIEAIKRISESREKKRIAAEMREAGIQKEKMAALTREQMKLQAELLSLKGIFTESRRRKIEKRLKEFEDELKHMRQ